MRFLHVNSTTHAYGLGEMWFTQWDLKQSPEMHSVAQKPLRPTKLQTDKYAVDQGENQMIYIKLKSRQDLHFHFTFSKNFRHIKCDIAKANSLQPLTQRSCLT